jgi:hypothetical protein
MDNKTVRILFFDEHQGWIEDDLEIKDEENVTLPASTEEPRHDPSKDE